MSGYMTLRQLSLSGAGIGSGAATTKRWFALHQDFVLYTFRSETDCHALTATPMPGYTVLSGQEVKGEPGVSDRDRERTIKMFYAPLMTSQGSAAHSAAVSAACRKAYFFVAANSDEVKRSGDVCVCISVRLSLFVLLFLSFFLSCCFVFVSFHYQQRFS